MTPTLHFSSLMLLGTVVLSAAMAFGPPKITVREVTDPRSVPAGAVLLVEGRHHDGAALQITGRAEGMQDGRRVTYPLKVTAAGNGRYGIAKQWAAGAPWLLVLSAGETDTLSHGLAEALVKVNAGGKVMTIDYPAPGWIGRTNAPRRTTEREIEALLLTLASRP